MVGELEGKINKAGSRLGTAEKGRRGGRGGWWDEKCKDRKKKVKRALKKWRNGEGERVEYRRKRGQYNRLCEQKKEKIREEFMERVGKARTEREVWVVVRQCRKRRRGCDDGNRMVEWRE
ncbi:hypothetical protein WN55_08611 [Dufourea novaeangliae]|uniref:Uncharacterized protein n=1 Tax=Dufourea novaeangliae TaxID=178035 RepID=A0A154PTA9_DUFNO|nr:hypothetical protein WN55_08611 [Dufourea novaeangliae]